MKYGMQLQGTDAVSLWDSTTRSLADFVESTVHGVAAIGHPQRFFSLLSSYQIRVKEHIFPDHYLYQKKDLVFQ